MTSSSPRSSSSRLSLVSFYGAFLRRSFTSADLAYQRTTIDDETTLSFWSPKHPTPEKPPLILIHGFGPRALWQWRQQVKTFSSKFSVYVPDLVFFGDSTTEGSERSEIFQAVTVGKLLEKLGLKKYSVVGTSYGGFVGYHMARMWPERVEKVVIASSAVNKTRKDDLELMTRGKVEKIEELMLPKTPAKLKSLIGLAMFKPPSILPDFLLNDFLSTLYSENLEEKKNLLMGLTIGKDDTAQLSPLKQEVLIVWGKHDKIFPLQKAIDLKEVLGEKVRLEVIENTSHIPQAEDPKQFNDIVMKFLSETS